MVLDGRSANLELIVDLFHHRWNVPVLASLQSSGSRFVVLQQTLGASREALRASLDALELAGLVAANPGYGHPLRPEYVLTDAGATLAPACDHYRTTADRLGQAAVAYRKWTAPLLLALREGHTRFSGLETALGSITPRALSQGLRYMCESDLVVRAVRDGYPPHASYLLTRAGERLARATADIGFNC